MHTATGRSEKENSSRILLKCHSGHRSLSDLSINPCTYLCPVNYCLLAAGTYDTGVNGHCLLAAGNYDTGVNGHCLLAAGTYATGVNGQSLLAAGTYAQE